MTNSGLVVVDKESGWTSHDVVAKMRGIAQTRKVGHAGTLDPMATGVLVLGLGKATRLLGHLSGHNKGYAATIRLGQATITDDADGEIIAESSASHLDDSQIRKAASTFVGPLMQVPSSVSAIKINGERAYARARRGDTVELPARPVSVSRFDVVVIRELGAQIDVNVEVDCSSGTYIRALARDLGQLLGTHGHLTALRRTWVGGFTIDQALRLDELQRELTVIPMDQAATFGFTTLTLNSSQAKAVRHGVALEDLEFIAADPVAMLSESGEFLALYDCRHDRARAIAVFV